MIKLLRNKIKIYLLLLMMFFIPFVYAMSKLPYGIESDMVKIAIKNEKPCFYLKDNNRYIESILVSKDSINIWDERFNSNKLGNSIDNCLEFSNEVSFIYNEPYRIYINDNVKISFPDSHRLDICIIKQYKKYYITKVDYINKAKGIMNCKKISI